MARSLTRRRFVSSVGAGIALVGSGHARNVSGTPRLMAGTPTVSSVPGAKYPAGWGPKELERTLQVFIGAFNSGDQATLSRFIPAKSGDLNTWATDKLLRFLVYGTVGTSKSGNHTNKTDVLADFAARHEQQEHWNLTALSVAPAGSSEMLLYQMLIERTVRGGSASLGLGAGLLYTPERTIPAWELLPAPAGLMRLTPPFTENPAASPAVTKAVENGDDQIPSGCDVPALVAAIRRFFNAFNAGDEDVLRSFIPRNSAPAGSASHGLSWYGVFADFGLAGNGFLGKSRDEVVAYFAARHKRHEMLRLLALPQVSWDARTGEMGFRPFIGRWADDVVPHIVTGKMGMYCPGFQIGVWSQGVASADFPPVLKD